MSLFFSAQTRRYIIFHLKQVSLKSKCSQQGRVFGGEKTQRCLKMDNGWIERTTWQLEQMKSDKPALPGPTRQRNIGLHPRVKSLHVRANSKRSKRSIASVQSAVLLLVVTEKSKREGLFGTWRQPVLPELASSPS